jgi:hypothetical protein
MKGLPRPEPAEFLAEVERRAGPHEGLAAAVVAAVDCLATHMTEPEKRAVDAGLTGDLAERLHARAWIADATVDELADELGAVTGLPQGRALELLESVAQTVAARLGEEDVAILAKQSPAIAALFAPRRFGAAPPHAPPRVAPKPAAPRTLAEGKPGSAHPISEARPERAHAHSVVRNPNPHGDTKLSSARGTTQEALAEDLAEGRPGPHPSWEREE